MVTSRPGLVLVVALGASATAAPTTTSQATERTELRLPLDAGFVAPNGRRVALGRYFDGRRPILLAIAPPRCRACTVVVRDVVAAARAMQLVAGTDYRLVVIGSDLRELVGDAGAVLDAELGVAGWIYLTGARETVDRIARVADLDDPTDLVVLTPHGELARSVHARPIDPVVVEAALVAARSGDAHGGERADNSGPRAPIAPHLVAGVVFVALAGLLVRSERRRRVLGIAS